MGYLIFDGVNDVVSQTGASVISASGSAYAFRVRGTINALPATGLVGLIGTSSNANSNGLVLTSAGALRVYAAGTNRYGSADGLITAGVLFDYTIDHASGGAWTLTNNLTSTVVASGTFTTTSSFATLNQFGRSSNNSANYLSANMEIFAITSPSLTEVWEADLSGGTGSVLPTVSGNNNGTLVNFPTDGSQWGGFSAGAITSSVAWSISPLQWQGVAETTLPTFSSVAAWSVSPLVWQASAAVSPPTFTSSAAWSVGPLQWQGAAAATGPTFTSAAAWSITPLVWQGAVSASAPGAITSSVAWAIGPLQWQGAASATVPTFTSAAAWSVGPMQWQGAANASAPGAVTSAAAWSVGPLQWQGAAAATVPTFSSAAAWSISPLVWQVSASVGGEPVFVAKGATITDRLQSRAIIERLQTARISE